MLGLWNMTLRSLQAGLLFCFYTHVCCQKMSTNLENITLDSNSVTVASNNEYNTSGLLVPSKSTFVNITLTKDLKNSTLKKEESLTAAFDNLADHEFILSTTIANTEESQELENITTEATEYTTDEHNNDVDKISTTPEFVLTDKQQPSHGFFNEIPFSSTDFPIPTNKKSKFLKDSSANINYLTLPDNSNVWTLVALKDNMNDTVDHTQTSDTLNNKEAVGTKNLSDWSKIMKEVFGLNKTDYYSKDVLSINTEKNIENRTEGHTPLVEILTDGEDHSLLEVSDISSITSTITTSTDNSLLEVSDILSTIPSITSTITTSTDNFYITDQIKSSDEIEINMAVTEKKQITANEDKIDTLLLLNTTESAINNNLLTTITFSKKESSESSLTEDSLSYEVHENLGEVNISYPNFPDIHNIMTKNDSESSNSNIIIAVSVSITCMILISLLLAFFYIMRKRHKQNSYSQRCRPVGLDAYSLDNVSVCHSIRRKGSAIRRQSRRIYSNAAFDDPSLKHNLLRAHDFVKFAEKTTFIFNEFRDIPQIIAKSDEVPHGCEDRNRYANVIPLPETRVILSKQDNDDKTEYINANYVRGPKDYHNYYIATQGPLESTITDFWRMIWEKNSRVIIMATDLLENGIEKCAEYLPTSVTLENHKVYKNLKISLVNRELKEKIAVSTLLIKNTITEESREVVHYWYKWPEVGVPSDVHSIVELLIGARASLKHLTNDKAAPEHENHGKKFHGPLTIHCSNGTGRTGTLIACDIAMRSLEEPTSNADIPQIAYYVRRGRASTIQTKEQYELIYKVLAIYASKITAI